jgi:hypothetical protein
MKEGLYFEECVLAPEILTGKESDKGLGKFMKWVL